MKFSVTVRGDNSFGLDTTGDSDAQQLTVEQLERLLRLWLLAATDSPTLTQQTLDAITERLRSNNTGLQAAIDAVLP